MKGNTILISLNMYMFIPLFLQHRSFLPWSWSCHVCPRSAPSFCRRETLCTSSRLQPNSPIRWQTTLWYPSGQRWPCTGDWSERTGVSYRPPGQGSRPVRYWRGCHHRTHSPLRCGTTRLTVWRPRTSRCRWTAWECGAVCLEWVPVETWA